MYKFIYVKQLTLSSSVPRNCLENPRAFRKRLGELIRKCKDRSHAKCHIVAFMGIYYETDLCINFDELPHIHFCMYIACTFTSSSPIYGKLLYTDKKRIQLELDENFLSIVDTIYCNDVSNNLKFLNVHKNKSKGSRPPFQHESSSQMLEAISALLVPISKGQKSCIKNLHNIANFCLSPYKTDQSYWHSCD